ncbi:MAG: transcription-repair coupling factor [Deltaproteobacteria bacterium]|nr:transcription-repair coupling factor [Deltaproteobacteria bacterium]
MSTSIAHIIASLEFRNQPIAINGLEGAARGYFVEQLLGRFDKAPLLFVTATADEAAALQEDLRLFLSETEAKRLALFSASDVPPYTQLSPEPTTWAHRLDTLYRLLRGEPLLVVAPVSALLRKLPPKSFVSGSLRELTRGQTTDRDEVVETLIQLGYEEVPLVEDEGSFARRGSLVDVWPPTLQSPVRIEWDEQKIIGMRDFAPHTQRSLKDRQNVPILAVRDFIYGKETRHQMLTRVRAFAEQSKAPGHLLRSVLEKAREGIAFEGLDTFLPAFYDELTTLLDYFPDDVVIIDDSPATLEAAAKKFIGLITEMYSTTESVEKIIPIEALYQTYDEWQTKKNTRNCLEWNSFRQEAINIHLESNTDIPALMAGHKTGEDMLVPFIQRLETWLGNNTRVVLLASSDVQRTRLSDLLRPHHLPLRQFDGPLHELHKLQHRSILLALGEASKGFRLPDEQLIVITDEEIFATKHLRRRRTEAPREAFTSISEMAEGDLIVHDQHGIGRFLGMKHLTIGKETGDYLLLEYFGGDKLYLPIYRINLIQRYVGAGESLPILDKLGGTRWQSAKQAIKKEIRLMAKDLLKLYALREIQGGYAFPPADTQYEEFSAAFPYTETRDQMTAIDDVMRDMDKDQPMDRLICGDVGYGKTEVAMRAAFRAVAAGKQAAVLVPTTVLAFQHFQTFRTRFASTPVAVDMVSRFRSAAEQKRILENVKAGKVDIIIGTHRLLSKDVSFRDLGLLIVDEEQRFGVLHKERIKKLKANVDVVTLTATPIPRTLNFSLVGIRDISVIQTPPANRHAIATHVTPFDKGVIRHAIKSELARGGQIFFVHNRVQTIKSMHETLSQIVPDARIIVGHGQMKEGELEDVMVRFVNKEFDVLLSTTIIESGLDIPAANTIIINRADTMGLAELYQLRGRVGRSSVQAFAYLLLPSDGETTAVAKRRLATLTRFTELGSGFQIAMHDLEIRGAGNILGSKQSGHIATVGYELYTKLLGRAIRQLSGKEEVEEDIDPELNLQVKAFLPAEYVENEGTRMELYRRLANRETKEELQALEHEILDRFGALPFEAHHLVRLMSIKIDARALKIRQLVFDGTFLSIKLDPSTPVQTGKLLSLMQRAPNRFKIHPPDGLVMHKEGQDDAFASAEKLLKALNACVSGESS